MKLDANQVKKAFLSEYKQVIKLETVINWIKQNTVTADFIFSRISKTIIERMEKNHYITFLFIKKAEPFQTLDKAHFFDCIPEVTDGFSAYALEVFDNSYSIDDIFQKYYHRDKVFLKDGRTFDLSDNEKERNKSSTITYINEIRKFLIDHDVYLWKSELDYLIENFKTDDVCYLKFHYGLQSDRSLDWEDEQLYKEFDEENNRLSDYLFDLWKEDDNRTSFFERIKSRISAETISKNLNKEVKGKTETAYLNIIQALKDELISAGGYRNQDELIQALSNKYQGYTGLSETNLKLKFALANRIK